MCYIREKRVYFTRKKTQKSQRKDENDWPQQRRVQPARPRCRKLNLSWEQSTNSKLNHILFPLCLFNCST